MTNKPARHLHRHNDYDTGHLLRVDARTGEIIVRRRLHRDEDQRSSFEAWSAKRRADKSLVEDHKKATRPLRTYDTASADTGTTLPDDQPKRRRGRPATTSTNPAAPYMPLLVIPRPLLWVDDIIRGSIFTSAGVTNGKINVRAPAVISALFQSDITAANCKTAEITLRTAQRIAKTARHAADGIASYIERHLPLRDRLGAELAAEALFQTT